LWAYSVILVVTFILLLFYWKLFTSAKLHSTLKSTTQHCKAITACQYYTTL